MELRKLLREEIEREFSELTNLAPGSNEASSAIEDLTKLYKLSIEETEQEWGFNEKYEARESETQLKEEQLKEQVKDRYFKISIDIAGIVVPMVFYAIWMRRGLKFEETGTYTSTTFRGLFSRFRPTMK